MPKIKTLFQNIPYKSLFGIMVAGGAVISQISGTESDVKFKAYRDPLFRPSICYNHRDNVKMTDQATADQCRVWANEDLTNALIGIVELHPDIMNHPGALNASGDFVMNLGLDAFKESPMLAHFKNGEWEKGCRSFVGHAVTFRFRHRHFQYTCEKDKREGWWCTIPAYQNHRQREARLCLNNVGINAYANF